MKDAQTEAINICQNALKNLAGINKRLEQISNNLLECQKKSPGAITLSFYGCGNNCLGCNHPRWRIWKNKGKDKSTFMAFDIVKSPLLHLRRAKKGRLSEYEETYRLVKEAVELIQNRSELIKAISTLKTKCKYEFI